MKEINITTIEGRIIGIIRMETNGDQTAYEYPSRRILGYYKAHLDITTDLVGRVLSRGNIVQTLFYSTNTKA